MYVFDIYSKEINVLYLKIENYRKVCKMLRRKSSTRLCLNQMVRFRTVFAITCASFMMYYYWINLENTSYDATRTYITKLTEVCLRNTKEKEKELMQKPPFNIEDKKGIFKDLKFMLLWTGPDYDPLSYFEEGQKSFVNNNCSVTNCYVTANKKFFKDIRNFHAVAINGRTMESRKLPEKRSPYQKYIYFNMESSDNYQVSDKTFDGFFNWTATYKLDSDIPLPYIDIKNMQGETVGPQINMKWLPTLSKIDNVLAANLTNKTKAAAWFVSNCNTRGGRNQFVLNLLKSLNVYGLTVDKYGECGPLKCFRNETNRCNAMLEKDYFFYMALENSFDEDYVTEKILTAMQHNVVPITFGGANYSRFLPPSSYLDANILSVEMLAASMALLMKDPALYHRFFRWKSQYTYSDPIKTKNVCAVCAALNNKEKFDAVTVYDQFRKWWNPDDLQYDSLVYV